MSLPVSLDSVLLTVFLDGGRWMELILGSVCLDDDVLSQINIHMVNKTSLYWVFQCSCDTSTVHTFFYNSSLQADSLLWRQNDTITFINSMNRYYYTTAQFHRLGLD